VIGPLVIAGVMVDEDQMSELVNLGVKDSKLLSPLKRQELADQIKETAVDTHIVKVSPAEIDKAVRCTRKLHKLNRLEAKTMAKVVETLRPDIAIVDAADVLPERYKEHIVECLSFAVKVISEHKADKKYPVVSAASIIAKVERDKVIEELKKSYGDFGSGYSSDARTKVFLRALAEKNLDYPHYVRHAWKSARLAREAATTKQLLLRPA
jgi:ribonuclease HII